MRAALRHEDEDGPPSYSRDYVLKWYALPGAGGRQTKSSDGPPAYHDVDANAELRLWTFLQRGQRMKLVTQDGCRTWCAHRNVQVSDRKRLYFDAIKRFGISIDLPAKPFELVALANELLPYRTNEHFAGALLWVTQTGVWSEQVERVGHRIFEAIRNAHDCCGSLIEFPGTIFDQSELVDLQVCSLQAPLIGWDAYLVPEQANYLVAFSHDETTTVVSRTPDIHDRLFKELGPWNPHEDSERYFRPSRTPSI